VLFAGAHETARSQAPTPAPSLPPCIQPGKALLNAPVIRSAGGKLRATLKNVDGKRTLWGSYGDDRCASQNDRFLTGYAWANPQPWPSGPDPITGPTFRAQLGDLVEIAFFNQVDPRNFAASLDRGTIGTMDACDQYTTGHVVNGVFTANTSSAAGDTMPDCLHGSSTTNVHFHGTHTTPSTTGDNVLLFIRPSLRVNGAVMPAERATDAVFARFFAQCEAHHPSASAPWPRKWSDLPAAWVTQQAKLVQQYDAMPMPNGSPMPIGMQLGTVDQHQIAAGLWPQYQMGAAPYCWPIPKYSAALQMGQAPGTQWYHAHKHGSTALNVANGMTGVFIIEGPYDQQLRAYYGSGLREQVLMIQQLSTAPFPITDNAAAPKPGAMRPRISVNGRLDPVVAMKPGEVQMWRVVNGAFRDAIQFLYFARASSSAAAFGPAATPCATPPPISGVVVPTTHWRQIAEDGVQLAPANYVAFGAQDNQLNLAAANRADLLVKAPTSPGIYQLCVRRNIGVSLQQDNGGSKAPIPLLAVSVGGAPISPPMDFIPTSKFPAMPAFLHDIGSAQIVRHRTVDFGGPGGLVIDGKPFIDGQISQIMKLNTAEEWVIKNEDNDKEHPFHIHINPFQILEVFQPNAATQPCPIDPNDPTTFDPDLRNFKPCANRALHAPWVWWDTFPIPASSRNVAVKCTAPASCPQLQKYALACSGGACTITIPGWFRMRSRFVDFTGQYVLHCHILIHEDRGMMELVEVSADPHASSRSPYSHH
jgi:FtsP/CotA-like multicopper oxidase with cupredoxin domain